ncbi:hypothetical protein [Novosphingobium terrae]|jgi:hypothetical protein|uniref:hypothetical protein n=1 Tax=Novosphingobium terrae TaxID=2726189 RepID=UPI00197E9925|nr:hypothetical protein [Novosphingobium terrae]
MVLRLSLCLFGRHIPRRSRVKWDGTQFIATCRSCECAIHRKRKGGWRKTTDESVLQGLQTARR